MYKTSDEFIKSFYRNMKNRIDYNNLKNKPGIRTIYPLINGNSFFYNSGFAENSAKGYSKVMTFSVDSRVGHHMKFYVMTRGKYYRKGVMKFSESGTVESFKMTNDINGGSANTGVCSLVRTGTSYKNNASIYDLYVNYATTNQSVCVIGFFDFNLFDVKLQPTTTFITSLPEGAITATLVEPSLFYY